MCFKNFYFRIKCKTSYIEISGNANDFFRMDGFTSPATTKEIIQMSIKGNTPKFDIGKTTKKYSFNDFKMLQEFYNKNTELVLREKELAAIVFYTDDGYLKMIIMINWRQLFVQTIMEIPEEIIILSLVILLLGI